MKKKNYFLLGLSVFLLGGTLLFNAPTEAQATPCPGTNVVTCTVGTPQSQPIGNVGGQWQVRGAIVGSRTSGTVQARVTQFRLGNRTTGAGSTASATSSNSNNVTVTAVSPWLADLNDTSSTTTTGSAW